MSRQHAIVLCFFLSGVASLILEVTWTRWLRLVFGSTTLAVSTILVAYMLGLGFGGLAGGRVASRLRNGIRAYGWIEVGIAGYALCLPWVFEVFPILNRGLFATTGFWITAVARFVVVLLVLLPPTLLMGATLPLLTGALTRNDLSATSRVALLYGVNTFGAVTGVFVSTFALFPAFGLWWTNATAAFLDMLVGVLALVAIAPRWETEINVERPAIVTASDVSVPGEGSHAASAAWARWNPALMAYGVVGFTALIYEVAWTRALSMILGSSIYAFAMMLAAFLAGIAVGSLAVRNLVARALRPLAIYGIGIGVLGASALGTMLWFRILPDLFVSVTTALPQSNGVVVAADITLSWLVMLVPTVVLGALFPLLARTIVSPARPMSDAVGDVYFINTIGAAAGALAAGFIFIPTLGVRRTLSLAIALDLIAAAGVLLWQQEWRGRQRVATALVGLMLAIGISLWPPTVNEAGLTRGVYRRIGQDPNPDLVDLPLLGKTAQQILYYRDGINTSVSVHYFEHRTSLRVNGKVDAGTGGDMPTQILLGQIPMLFGKRAERVLVIGLGSGVTVGSAALHEPTQLDVVELEPAVVEASHFFDDYNHRPLERPNVRLIADDARAYLGRTHERYDVIISEPSNPWITGAASLFTREFFHTAHQALLPGGRFCQWLQLYESDPSTLQAVLTAFHSEFPTVYGFANTAQSEDFFLLGMEQPLGDGDLPVWHDLRDSVRDDLRRARSFSNADLWSLIQLRPTDVEAIVRQTDLTSTDDGMQVELRLPWLLHRSLTGENWRFLDRFRHGIDLSNEDPEALGFLALAYADQRADAQIAESLLRGAQSRGGSVHAFVAEAVMMLQRDPAAVDGALGLLDTAVARGPQFFAPWYYRARTRQAANQLDEALGDVNVALQIWQGDWRARHLRLRLLALLRRPTEARAEAEALLATSYPQMEAALWGDAALQAGLLGQYATAIEEMERYLEALPNSYGEWAVLASWYEKIGDHEKARESQINAQHSRHNAVVALHRVARQRMRASRNEDAIANLKMAVTIDPNYEPARQELRGLGVADVPSRADLTTTPPLVNATGQPESDR